jgi:hypothetical protein
MPRYSFTNLVRIIFDPSRQVPGFVVGWYHLTSQQSVASTKYAGNV